MRRPKDTYHTACMHSCFLIIQEQLHLQAARRLNKVGEENVESYEKDWNLKKEAMKQMLLARKHLCC